MNSKGAKSLKSTVEGLLHNYLKNISAADVIKFAATVVPLILAEQERPFDFAEAEYHLSRAKKDLSYMQDNFPDAEEAVRFQNVKADIDLLLAYVRQ